MLPLVIRADARDLPLDDDSVDLVVTSPPYFALRSYTDGGEHYAGQIGDEPSPTAFVESLLDVTRECMRVLKPSGSIWVNLGDKYAQATERRDNGVRQKSLVGIPWRYALRCIDDLGLILRAEVIWSKPNGLPESVTDRVRRSHEQWFHFVMQPRYYSAVDEIRERHAEGQRPGVLTWEQRRGRQDAAARYSDQNGHGGTAGMAQSPLGKLPGSVWEIPTQPLKVPEHLGVDHFAAFPMEWPRRIIQGWSPSGICTECGEGRQPLAVQVDEAYAAERARVRARRTDQNTDRESALYPAGRTNAGGFSNISNGVMCPSYAIRGYACSCPEPTAPTRPSVVLDPFGGTGTTALVARSLGRLGVSVDRSADYCHLASWRTSDPGEFARALQVEKPPPPPEDMDSLLDLLS